MSLAALLRFTFSLLCSELTELPFRCSYAWCRAVDDLIDKAASPAEARANLALITAFLAALYPTTSATTPILSISVEDTIAGLPGPAQHAFRLLAALPIPCGPLDELVAGFATDLEFSETDGPVIGTDEDLMQYASDVASSVAELCVRLAWHHSSAHSPRWTPSSDDCSLDKPVADATLAAARRMGQALQLTNIARDVPADARLGRTYIPLPSPSIPDLQTREGLERTTPARLELVHRARALADSSWDAIDNLPEECRGAMRAACAVYMQIGEEVERELRLGKVEGRASAGRWTRIKTAWRAMS